jgi:pimeloyl-ACP methyl ester carboxylesterase
MVTLPPEVQAIYPWQPKRLAVDGGELSYIDEGPADAPVMLCVHGNPTWSFYWRKLVAKYAGDFRVIVPDHIGCGLSDKPEEDAYSYRLERRVEDLERLIEYADLGEKITLVVHDWGGMIGMAWAARHPERVERLVILNTAAFHLPAGKQVPFSLRLSRSALGAFLVRGLNLFCRGALRYCATQRRLTPGERRAYLAPYDSWEHRLAVHRFIQDIPLDPADPGYDLVSKVQAGLQLFRDTPTLLLWGMRDFVFDPSYLEEWERRMPHARVHRYAEAGHYVLEDARDEVRSLVEGFVAETSMAETA